MRIKNVLFMVVGFIGGAYAMLKAIVKTVADCPDVLLKVKTSIIDRIEYLLLGYNTIKTKRNNYTYRDYIRKTYGFSDEEEN